MVLRSPCTLYAHPILQWVHCKLCFVSPRFERFRFGITSIWSRRAIKKSYNINCPDNINCQIEIDRTTATLTVQRECFRTIATYMAVVDVIGINRVTDHGVHRVVDRAVEIQCMFESDKVRVGGIGREAF